MLRKFIQEIIYIVSYRLNRLCLLSYLSEELLNQLRGFIKVKLVVQTRTVLVVVIISALRVH